MFGIIDRNKPIHALAEVQRLNTGSQEGMTLFSSKQDIISVTVAFSLIGRLTCIEPITGIRHKYDYDLESYLLKHMWDCPFHKRKKTVMDSFRIP